MTQSFEDLMVLLGCAARGLPVSCRYRNFNFDDIYRLGFSHGVWTIVYPLLKECGTSDVPQEKLLKYDAIFFGITTKNIRRSMFIYEIKNKLEAKNIKCCLVKGETLAELYKEPNLRISSDTDFLFDAGKVSESEISDAMAQLGFSEEYRPKTSHHAMFNHDVGGRVEFHLRLYDEIFEDVWFENLTAEKESWRSIKFSDGREYNTLGITDGAIFVSMHLIKHFLSKGVGLRQLMDTLLYLSHYKEQIDWQRFNDLMKELKFDKFMALCADLGEKYFGFEKKDFEFLPGAEFDDACIENFLNDMEFGGKFGGEDKAREDFYKRYTQARFEKTRSDDYDSYMQEWKEEKWTVRLFPPAARLEKEYTYLKGRRILLPVAWVHHLIKFVIKKFTKTKKEEKNIAATEKRMDLISQLDMI